MGGEGGGTGAMNASFVTLSSLMQCKHRMRRGRGVSCSTATDDKAGGEGGGGHWVVVCSFCKGELFDAVPA